MIGNRSNKNSKYSLGASLAQAIFWPIDWFFWRLSMLWKIITGTVSSKPLAFRSISTIVIMTVLTVVLIQNSVQLEPIPFGVIWIFGIGVRWGGQGHENHFISSAYHYVLSVFMALLLATVLQIPPT